MSEAKRTLMSVPSPDSRDLRRSKLLDHVMERQRIEVTDLSEMFEVSEVTIRKDLDYLQSQRLLRREHGFAVAASADDIAGRLAYHRALKERIASAAASLVADGETVMIESGSACVLLAEALVRSNRNITIVTNSVFIAEYLRDIPQAVIVLLGGAFQARSEVTVGPHTAEMAARYAVDKLFVGADGYSRRLGFMAKDVLRCEAARAMAKSASRLIVLTQSSKLTTLGTIQFASHDEVSLLVTDDGIRDTELDELRDNGV